VRVESSRRRGAARREGWLIVPIAALKIAAPPLLLLSAMAAMYADEAAEAVVQEEHEHVGPAGPHVLSALENMGIAASDLKKLQEAGIHTVEGLSHASNKRLIAIKGLTEQKIKKMRDAGAARWGRWRARRARGARARFGLTALLCTVAAQPRRLCRTASRPPAPSSCSGAAPS
jgi:hypothetical protein